MAPQETVCPHEEQLERRLFELRASGRDWRRSAVRVALVRTLRMTHPCSLTEARSLVDFFLERRAVPDPPAPRGTAVVGVFWLFALTGCVVSAVAWGVLGRTPVAALLGVTGVVLSWPLVRPLWLAGWEWATSRS